MPEPSNTINTDHYIYKFITKPLSKHICWISPNVITALNMLMIIPVLYNIIFNKPLWQLVGFMVFRQIIDCLDGTVARNCKTSSNYGFFLDVVSDLLYHYTILIVLLFKVCSTKGTIPYIRCIFLLIIMIYYIYCFLDTIVTKKHKTAIIIQDNSILFIIIAAILIKQFF